MISALSRVELAMFGKSVLDTPAFPRVAPTQKIDPQFRAEVTYFL
jgi:hypothetical protein